MIGKLEGDERTHGRGRGGEENDKSALTFGQTLILQP